MPDVKSLHGDELSGSCSKLKASSVFFLALIATLFNMSLGFDNIESIFKRDTKTSSSSLISMSNFVPVEAPSIYPESPLSLLAYMEQRQRDVSEGIINDFNPSSPITAFNEGVLWAILEMLAYADRIPLAASIFHLRTAAIARRLGEKARVTLTIQLTTTVAYWELNKGYRVATNSALQYETDEALFIYNGDTGTVSATAVGDGTQYNQPILTVNVIIETRAFLQSITNYEPAAGGIDAETDQEVFSRGFASLRRHNTLVTEDDFKQYIEFELGDGSVVKVIGRLGADKASYIAGAIHIFVLNQDGSQTNDAQRTALLNKISPSLPSFLQNTVLPSVGTGVFVSSIEFYDVEFEMTGTIVAGDDPATRAAQIWEDLTLYLDPRNLKPGETVILYNLISICINAGIKDVQNFRAYNYTLNDSGTEDLQILDSNIPMPNEWTLIRMLEVRITLIDKDGNIHEYFYGNGGSPD